MWKQRFMLACPFLIAAVAVGDAGAAVVGPGCEFTDLQAAIDAADATSDPILVTTDYVGGPIRIDGKQLTITGGVAGCDDPAVVAISTLDASTVADNVPVVDVGGTVDVDIENFAFTGGHNDGGNGGGVRFVSVGAHNHLGLHRVHVASNRAAIGAGIYFDARTGDILAHELVLDTVRIDDNIASASGGGISLRGGGHLIMDVASAIVGNIADPGNMDDGRGGGLDALVGSRSDIAGAITGNTARLGGGIAIHDTAVVQLASIARERPVAVRENMATERGGGIWSMEHGRLCAFGYAIDDNIAPTGAAVDMHDAAGFNSTEPCGIPGPNYHNSISGNRADDDGNIVFLEFGMFSDKLVVARNHADVVFAGTSFLAGFGASQLTNCEIQHNDVQRALSDFTDLLFDSCTIADNAFAANAPLFVDRGILQVQHSIVWQPGVATVVRAEAGAGAVTFNDVLTADEAIDQEADSVSGVTVAIDPAFVNATSGNYTLRPESVAVDYYADCIANGFVDDEIGAARGFVIRDANRPCDIGALELTSTVPPDDETIFVDGFDGSSVP
jgi:hypothetical protein